MSSQFKEQQMEGKVWWQEWRMSGHVLSFVRRQKGTTVCSFTAYCIQDSTQETLPSLPGRSFPLSGGEPAT